MLAGLSLRDSGDRDAIVSGLGGGSAGLFEYLVEEVLADQSEEIQEFLLNTSVLARLTGPLCDAVTGRKDGSDVLRRLARMGLFTLPLDEQGQWYRYHRLFSDFLNGRLRERTPDLVSGLHQRAARWFEDA